MPISQEELNATGGNKPSTGIQTVGTGFTNDLENPGGGSSTPTPTPIPGTVNPDALSPQIPIGEDTIGVADFGANLVTDPSLLVSGNTSLQDSAPQMGEQAMQDGSIDNPNLVGNNYDANNVTPATAQQAAPVNAPQATDAANVETQTTQQDVANAAMTGAQGTVGNQSQVTAPQFDVEAIANGDTATGKALNDYASQNMSNIIDTSTIAGKMLADQLGEGNYTDSKATVKGQLDILQAEFQDANGNPKIPSWAAATARSVARISAFKGVTGTAAIAAMSQALMEASLPIASQDAQFFQTLTIKNLDNKQQSIINRANVLSKYDLTNMDMRMTAAVENANKFMQMDLANLSNEQQASVINTQARVQSILEDAKSENTNRLFMAQSQNEKDQFYASLGASIDQFNATQTNTMAQFNTGEINTAEQFNSQMENNREQFYKDMQFQIDTANAKWRQTVTLQDNANAFEAASTDVKNLLGVSTEQLNRLWDRADSVLDYVWKSAENEADRNNQLVMIQTQARADSAIADQQGAGNIFGSVLGAFASAAFGWLFA